MDKILLNTLRLSIVRTMLRFPNGHVSKHTERKKGTKKLKGLKNVFEN